MIAELREFIYTFITGQVKLAEVKAAQLVV